jgi:pyruvate dehydrogenase E2 component (dihydrolipoamide acetyltransferase)
MDRTGPVRAVPAARWKARREEIDLSSLTGTGPDGVILLRDLESLRQLPKAPVGMDGLLVSSLARKLAAKRGIALSEVAGTGTHGRVMLADVDRTPEASVSARDTTSQAMDLFGQTIPMSRMRGVIARRMTQSAFTAPHVYFFADVEMDRLHRLRDEILPEFEARFGVRLSVNDLLVKATALTILEFPLLNGRVEGETIRIMPEIHIGLAVALPDGLIVPAIPRADQLGLGNIARIRADLVTRARAGRLKMEEIERGTFTVSSLAQFDITFFTAILNPPQSGILSVGKTGQQLNLVNGELVAKEVARFGLSVDHRVIDGAVAAAFMQSLKRRLENPGIAFIHL